jgi:hypothetical protein
MSRTDWPGRAIARPRARTASSGMCPALAFALLAIAAPAGPARAQAPAGVVYIESNVGHSPGNNAILAFRRDAAGHLAPLGSVPTGGTGVHPPPDSTPFNVTETLGPFDSDQNIILNRRGTRLFAVNSGSDTIAVFDVRRNGGLVPVPGSPFPSGGVNPVSLGLALGENVLVVVNKDYDLGRPGFDPAGRAPNYTTFRVAPRGRLIPIAGSTIVAARGGGLGPGNSTPSQALIVHGVRGPRGGRSPDGRLVFDVDVFGLSVHSFAVRPNGRLVRVQSAPIPASEFVPNPAVAIPQGLPVPFGVQVHPREPVVYNSFGLQNQLGVSSYDATGRFQYVRSVPGAGLAICWLVTDAAGTRLYTSNTATNSISVFDVTQALQPVKLQEFPLALPPGAAPDPLLGPPASSLQLALDPRGEFLFVITQRTFAFQPPEANALNVLRLGADGRIVEQTDRVVIPTFPSRPQGVVAR